MKKNTTPVVDAIGELNFEGNIIPHSWYQYIKLPVGKRELKRKEGKQSPKADYIAIILLSDVIYWYRPTIRRDELTGEVVSIEKKFYEDMLQKQYETWGELFGFTKIQTRNAVLRLVDAGLLKREFRSITSKSGMKLNNVMFVEPIIEAIKRITFTHPETRAIVERLPPYLLQSGEVCTLKSVPTLFEVDTNTETTTETTTENVPISNKIGAQIGFLEEEQSGWKKSLEDETPNLFVTPLENHTLLRTEYSKVGFSNGVKDPGQGEDITELHYVRRVIKHFNTLHEKYPDKISQDVIVPRKIESLAAKKYAAVRKWYVDGRTADEVCDALTDWVGQTATSVGGLNYFAKKPFPQKKRVEKNKGYSATQKLIEKLK